MRDISQDALLDKMQVFLVAMGEGFPAWSWKTQSNSNEKVIQGLCESFSFMLMRATLIKEEKKYFNRLQALADVDENKVKEMARLLLEYRKQYAVIAVKEKSRLTARIDKCRKNKNRIITARDYHHAFIKKNIFSSMKLASSDISLLEYANELYVFISSLLFVSNPGNYYQFRVQDGLLNIGDYQPLYHLLGPDKYFYQKKYSIQRVFSFAFVYKEAELINTLDKVLQAGDHVRISNTEHVMYLKVCHNKQQKRRYTLYDPNDEDMPIENIRLGQLVEKIKENLFTSYDSTFMPVEVNTYVRTSQELKTPARINTSLLVQSIFKSRKKQHDLSIDARAWDKTTSLIYAASVGDEASVKILLKKGADVEAKDSADFSALSLAIMCGHVGVVKALLEYNAVVKLSHMIRAVQNGYYEVVKVILPALKEQGVAIHQPNAKSDALLSLAIKYQHPKIISLFQGKDDKYQVVASSSLKPMRA